MAKDPEGIFDIETIVQNFNDAFVSASGQLRREFEKKEWADSPFIYHMPKMSVSIQMSLSFSKGKVMGLITKREKREESEMVTTVDIDLVSVPRTPDEIGPREEPEVDSSKKPPDKRNGEAKDEKDGKKERRATPAPDMPTWIPLRSPNVMPHVVNKLLKDKGFSNIQNLQKVRGTWRCKAVWSGEEKELAIDASDGSIKETTG